MHTGPAARVQTRLPAAAAMLLTHEQGSPLHCAVTRLLCAALNSPEESLWAPLLEEGWGEAAAAAGVTPIPATSGSLQTRLAAAATSAAEHPPGKRPCNVGVVVALADYLRELEGDEDPPHLLLREKLEGDATWQQFVGEEGALEALKLEQRGALCGPKPMRSGSLMDLAEGGGLGGLGGAGGMISGRELLQVLQSLSAQHAASQGQ